MHPADLPAPGTNDVYRVCTPFPFEANMTLSAAQHDMELHIDNFEAFVYYSPGARASLAGPCMPVGARHGKRSSRQPCALEQEAHRGAHRLLDLQVAVQGTDLALSMLALVHGCVAGKKSEACAGDELGGPVSQL